MKSAYIKQTVDGSAPTDTTPGCGADTRPPFSALLIWCMSSAVLLTPSPVAAQSGSRQDTVAAQQAEKANVARPYVANKVEAWLDRAETLFMLDPSGFFPYFDSVYQGGGLTLGGGYRKFYGDNTFWDVKGLYSVLNYKLVEGTTISKDHLNKKLNFGARLGWRDATQVGFYGIGIDSQKEARTNFRFQQTYMDGNAELRPKKWLPIKGSVGFEVWNTMEGQGKEPSIETGFTPSTTPGLGADPEYIHSKMSAGIDWRQSPGYSRRGGLYEATFHDYHNTNGGTYTFQKFDAEVIQYVPILRDTWVLAGRGRVETTLNDNDAIPYFLLPYLGSGSTLRGYESYRFRDRHSMLMQAEFRWIPAVGMDMALFYDAGKVTSRRSDLDFTKLKSDVGIGVRFHGLVATPLRVDFAVGNEGWRIVFSGGPVF